MWTNSTKFQKRIDIMILRNQGWSFNQIARKYVCSAQAISHMFDKIKDKTIEELEEEYKDLI